MCLHVKSRQNKVHHCTVGENAEKFDLLKITRNVFLIKLCSETTKAFKQNGPKGGTYCVRS